MCDYTRQTCSYVSWYNTEINNRLCKMMISTRKSPPLLHFQIPAFIHFLGGHSNQLWSHIPTFSDESTNNEPEKTVYSNTNSCCSIKTVSIFTNQPNSPIIVTNPPTQPYLKHIGFPWHSPKASTLWRTESRRISRASTSERSAPSQ